MLLKHYLNYTITFFEEKLFEIPEERRGKSNSKRKNLETALFMYTIKSLHV